MPNLKKIHQKLLNLVNGMDGGHMDEERLMYISLHFHMFGSI